MSVLFDGLRAANVSYSSSSRSVLSARFRNLLPNNARLNSLLVTTLVRGHHPISLTLAFQLAKHSPYDVVLGLDWAAFIRDSMLNIGYRLDSTFNAALWVSDPAHPLSHDRRVSSSSLSVSNGASVGQSHSSAFGPFPSELGNLPGVHGSLPVDVNQNNYAYNSEYNSEPLPGSGQNNKNAACSFVPYQHSGSSNIWSTHEVSLHAVPSDDILLTIRDARHTMVTHFIAGSCANRFPESHVAMVAQSLGLKDLTRLNLNQHLDSRRTNLVSQHAKLYPARVIFSNLDSLPKGTLTSLALSHGLSLTDNPNRDDLRTLIVSHIAMGCCTPCEDALPLLACSSMTSQLDSEPQPSSPDDASERLQIYIMRQVAPILSAKPLKRLLDMHDIKYPETAKLKKLRNCLYSFLDRLDRGKFAVDDISLSGTARRARRRELKRLRAEWPQVVPDHLKRRLIRDFNLEISASNLATFACSSCNKLCPVTNKQSIGLEEFDLDLLSRPDHVSSNDSDMDVDSGDDQDTRAEPWFKLDSRYPEPPMPMVNTPYPRPVPPELKDLTIVEEAIDNIV
ncbi:hypothetical protein B0H13DRAFT_1898962 [Mycena leptocephala]|nr:hypothetical protein B0H13DRAFT_1898962 [Mycena leptocephala]